MLTNPPFGRKRGYRIVRDYGEIDTELEDYDREDFFVTIQQATLLPSAHHDGVSGGRPHRRRAAGQRWKGVD
jgi:hypothetical protein